MSQLELKGEVEVLGKEIPNIAGGFGKEKRSMLAKDIADFHEKETWRVNEAINNNYSRFKENVDLIDLKGNEFAHDLIESGFITQNSYNASQSIYLLSERGYAKLIKIFDDDVSWEMYDKLLDDYFEMREENQVEANANQFDLLRSMVDQMEQMDKRTRKAEQEAMKANKGVEKIQDTFAQIDDDWRQYVNKVFSKIGRKTGDYRSYRKESYIMLDRRAGVDLQQRLKNKKKRMKRNGSTKTAIKEANKLDVIEDSKKLTEIYVNIVQEFEVKHLNQEAS